MSPDLTDDEEPESDGTFAAGDKIVDRYELLRQLGSGTYGVVWEARDHSTDRAVAVKLLREGGDLMNARAQLEAAALKHGLPGVVGLLDDGEYKGQAFFVMELVHGRPFPGADPPQRWEDIAPVFVALLETLGRVHSAFVIHRDLKPTNVLVTSDGHVRLLDFGAAYRFTAGSDESIDRLELLGTPAYMAPEQVRHQAISERTDLYALGVMLYEALAGRLPHDGKTPGLLLANRLMKPPLPLLDVAPNVPPNVARLIERMLAVEPSQRPSSAFEVLATLRGEKAVEESDYLWLGSRARFDLVLRAARGGRSVDVVGPHGSGRTRWLMGVEELVSDARRIHWIRPPRSADPAAFESLSALIHAVRGASDPARLAPDEIADAVRSAIARGDLLLADDFERLDPSSRELLERARSSGGVVRALLDPGNSKRISPLDASGSEAVDVSADDLRVTIAPLEEIDLRALFAGPDRLLHLREDAARILYQRAGGLPSRVVNEVNAWISLGIARRSFNLLVVARDGLDRLAAGAIVAAPQGDKGAWSEGLRRDAHADVAKDLPPGQEGRLLHLLLSGADTRESRLAIAREAIAVAENLLRVGHLGAAVAAIETGLRPVREAGAFADNEKGELFALWLDAALQEGSPRAVYPLLHALFRAEPWPDAEAIGAIAQVLKVEKLDSSRALDLARAIPPQSDARLERLRVCALMHAVHLRRDDAEEERVLDELAVASGARDPEIAARIDTLRGRLRYRQSRFREAAALHESAARSGPTLHRLAAKTAGAWALIEAFELDRARALATEAKELAAERRHSGHEASATWTLRAIDYRLRAWGPPDMELVGAVSRAAGRHIQGAILFTEAAFAFRARQEKTVTLATESYERLSAIDEPRGSLLMRCLLVAVGQPVTLAEAAALQGRALEIEGAGIGIQALGLLAMGGIPPTPEMTNARLATLTAPIPERHFATPMDVLSVEESLQAIAASRRLTHRGSTP